MVAADHGVTREEQDAFALESQRRCAAALAERRFDAEIVPVNIPRRKGDPVVVDVDEHPRPDSTDGGPGPAAARVQEGRHGHGRELVGHQRRRRRAAGGERGARAGAGAASRWRASSPARWPAWSPTAWAWARCPATRKALERAGWRTPDLDLVELNEAFAAQAIPCMRQLELDPERVNVNGGAIALGHPVGCSGARIVVTLLHEMRRRDARRGLATMCIGVGQGIAMLVEAA